MPKFPLPQLKREEIEREPVKITSEGILEIKYKGEIPKKAYINTAVDLGAFYKEFRNVLLNNWENIEFTDKHGKLSEQKKGNFLEHYPTSAEYKDPAGGLLRPEGIYIHHYVWAKHNGFEEHECVWWARCKATYSKRAWYEFRMRIDVRNLVEREVLEGNKKKKLYYGTWEFRNEMYYKSKIIPDFLHKIPIVRNSPVLQELYMDYTYYNTMKADMVYIRSKIIPMLYEVINKHFKPGKE